jgi:hypothetical protein
MRTITLDIEEWQRVLGVLAQGQWATVNPLIMKIGEQLRMQEPAPDGVRPRGNGADAEAAPERG